MNQKKFLDCYDFKFKKKYGQNFIIDDNILRNIIEKSNIPDDTLIVEIGCGAGALTRKLKSSCKYLIGYEIDQSLKPILKDLDNLNCHIIFDDFLKRNINDDLKEYVYSHLFIVSNLPYYITTPIISKIINDRINVDKIVVMVQKEVGDRFSAKTNSKSYGSLTVFINTFFDVKKLFLVSRNVFIPKPNVDSIVISLIKKENKLFIKDYEVYFKLIRDSFRQKRKTLKNNLKGYDLDLIRCILLNHGFNENVRAEEIPLKVFVEIANALCI